MAFVVTGDRNEQLFEVVTRRNLYWQFELLQDNINYNLANIGSDALNFSAEFLDALNHFAVVNLTARPGKVREHDVHIKGSDHAPSRYWKVGGYLGEFIKELNRDWRDRDPFEASAYVLWRLNWIHPYAEGNGRTARAASYYVLCKHYEILLPGKNTIVSQLSGNADYYAGLRHADNNLDNGTHDLQPLIELLQNCFEVQLRSADIKLN